MTCALPSKPFRIGLLQHSCIRDRDANLDIAIHLAQDAVDRGAELIITQELFTLPYFPQAQDEAYFSLAEPIPGPTTQCLTALAAKLHVAISASLFEKRASGVFHNTSVMINPEGSIVARYRKMHIPDDPRFYEKFYFAPGDLGFSVPQLAHCRMGMLICWDQWFPEAARLAAMAGAQILLYPTAIGSWHICGHTNGGDAPHERAMQQDAWQTIQRSHAIANGVFVATVNRIGKEGELKFWGSSFVVDPTGTVIAEAPTSEAVALVVDCDLRKIDAVRQAWPFLRDRRIDHYGGLTQRLLDGTAH